MSAASTIKRFCSCADVPPQVRDDAQGCKDEDSLSRVGVRVVSEAVASAPDELQSRGETRFCTCSGAPGHLSDQVFAESEVENETVEPQSPSGEEDERQDGVNTDPNVSVLKSGADADSTDGVAPELRSVSDLFPGETTVDSVSTHGKGGSEVVLTNMRVLLRGAPEANLLHASMPLSEIDSLAISRARPNRRSLVWGLVGIGAAIGMWQALDGVGNMRLIVGAVMVLMSAVLLADYFLRPPDLQVVFRSHSGAEMVVEFGQSHVADADRFAAQVLAKLENSPTH